jgi:predicted permease
VRLYEEVLARLSALPGVVAAALTRDVLPGRGGAVTVTASAAAASARGVAVDAVPMLVSPDFFRTVGITIRQGRSFSSSDPARTAVIDEAMARRLWPGASPIGRTFTVSGRPDEVIEVVGTVPDASDASRGRGAQPVFYRPFPQEYSSRMTILLRAGGDPAALVPEARRTIAEVNRDVSLVDLRTVDQMIEAADAQRRLPATVLSVVGSLAVLLSAVGLYGVVAYGVRERAHELGIRLALGARPADVSRLILRQGFMIVGIGLALGILGAVGGGRVAQAALFGVNGLDGWTMAAVCALLSMTGFVALYVPARWASRLEPARTLRDE